MVLGRRFVLKHHFVGHPKPEDFDLVEKELPALQDGDIQFWILFLTPTRGITPPPFTMIGG